MSKGTTQKRLALVIKIGSRVNKAKICELYDYIKSESFLNERFERIAGSWYGKPDMIILAMKSVELASIAVPMYYSENGNTYISDINTAEFDALADMLRREIIGFHYTNILNQKRGLE